MKNRFIRLKGIIPPMVTPLIDNNTLDCQGAVRLVEHMIAGGVHGIFILGTTGEAQSLAYHLRYELTELVCSTVAGRIPVLVGVTDTSLEESLRLAHKAAECGAAAVVAAPPYYFAPSQPELIMYYKALADALPLPLCLYNMPVHVKVSLEPATVKELAAHPNIIGLEDSSSNMVYFQTLMYELADLPDFALFMGPEQLTAESVMLGAAGGVNGGANVFPELYVALYEAAAANDLKRVKELQRYVMAVAASLYTIGRYGSSAIKGIKCALSLMGICSDYLSYPYQCFLDTEREKVRAVLEDLRARIRI